MALTVSGSGNDPILGQSFFVDFQGKFTGYFTKCSGFSSENEVIVNKSVDQSGRTRIRKIPGPNTINNITFSKGITNSLELWNWIKAIADGNIESNRVNGTISLCTTTGAVIATWDVIAAWPVRVASPSMGTEQGQVGIEEVELAIEAFTRTK